MNPTILGVIGPGFLNQVPTLGLDLRLPGPGESRLELGIPVSLRLRIPMADSTGARCVLNPKPLNP